VRTTTTKILCWQQLSIGILLLFTVSQNAVALSLKKSKTTPAQLRTEYLAKLQEKDSGAATNKTVGSLWVSGGTLGDLSTDFKAQKLNDTIVILVAVQTTAAQSGNSSYQRAFQTNSGITGLSGVPLHCLSGSGCVRCLVFVHAVRRRG